MEFINELRYQDKNGSELPDSLQAIPRDRTNISATISTRYIHVMKDNVKKLPELYSSSSECCGCSACYSICPMSGSDRNLKISPAKTGKIWIGGYNGRVEETELTGAITMLPDSEGFLYPVVDASICIRCYKCLNVCVFKYFSDDNCNK